jgi:prepilin-type N-terminal cleavage/methylation domain-containing protein
MRNKKGFTLIEIIATITIISILIAISVPVSMSYINDANIRKAKNEANSVLTIANTYFNSNQSSLAGTYIESKQEQVMTDKTILNNIVSRAKVSGTINKLKYSNGEVEELEYETNNIKLKFNKAKEEFDEVH